MSDLARIAAALEALTADIGAVRAELGELRARVRPRRAVAAAPVVAIPSAMREEIRTRLSQPKRKRRRAA